MKCPHCQRILGLMTPTCPDCDPPKRQGMLILSRRIGETVVIGDDITVQVLGIRSGNQIRLGITAPKSVSVDRSEIRARKVIESQS